MKNDIVPRHSVRVRRQGEPLVARTWDYTISETNALKRLQSELTTKGKKPSFSSILIDGTVRGIPRFGELLKQEEESNDQTIIEEPEGIKGDVKREAEAYDQQHPNPHNRETGR